MNNPWEDIKLDDYEKHMSLDSVKQLQAMNAIMKEQFDRLKPEMQEQVKIRTADQAEKRVFPHHQGIAEHRKNDRPDAQPMHNRCTHIKGAHI